ncbi:hypothetical protein N6L24_12160 [Cognatishimia sp. SS12]|uniref:hypothetical protein n=1 Tax=Cognatishimia sp. SS12 TaxID=2979465 RepID=UPI00232CAF6D|nr:hypothetical protein [Cognatishimia sp. SS12]MDC0739034.1 hypothetical protein [Cognatishimia sp. SS12]
MRHDWILEVLADLRSYAVENDLPQLAAELDELTLLAAVELSNLAAVRAPMQGKGRQDLAQ